jgi:hypothetical protein
VIKIETVVTPSPEQWMAIIMGCRNPLNSWHLSDSEIEEEVPENDENHSGYSIGGLYIGKKDYDLMVRLRNAGTDHRKFMRMITVYADITAPLYWWKEFDTYKVGTVANSCSTMHKIAAKKFTESDFSAEHLFDFETEGVEFPVINGEEHGSIFALNFVIKMMNFYREKYLETKDKRYWWQLIQLLPSSYNQKRTVMLNYETLTNMYHSRRNHKLDEWLVFCDWAESLPFSKLILGDLMPRPAFTAAVSGGKEASQQTLQEA